MTRDTINKAVAVAGRDDPFLARRMATQARLGMVPEHDYTRTRRTPAMLGDRFSYTTLKTKKGR